MMRYWKAIPNVQGSLPRVIQRLMIVLISCQYCSTQPTELNRFNSIYQQKCVSPTKCRPDIQTATTTVTRLITQDEFTPMQTFPPPKYCCGNCSCSEECHVYGNCCPDMFSTFPDRSYIHSLVYSCLYPQYIRYGHSSVNQHWPVWLIGNCNSTCMNESLIRKCQDLDNLPPVFDKSGNHYKNLYCALCNSLKTNELTVWKSNIQCEDKIFLPRSKTSMLEDLLNRRDCNLLYSSNTTSYLPEQCNSSYAEKTRCNVTGFWNKYDEFTEKACLSFSAPVGTYRNWFCYKCNVPLSAFLDPPSCDSNFVVDVFPSFSAILDFNPYVENKVHTLGSNQCTPGYVYNSLKDTCLEVICTEGWELIGESCQKLIHNPKGLSYRVFLKFRPLNPEVVTLKEGGRLLGTYVQGELTEIQFDQFVSSFILYYLVPPGNDTNDAGDDQDQNRYYVIVLDFCFDFEADDRFLIDKMLAQHCKNITIYYKETEVQFHAELQNLTATSDRSGFSTQEGRGNLIKLWNVFPKLVRRCHDEQTTPLVITMFTSCPTVVLRQEEFNLTVILNSLFIQEYHVTLERIQFLEINGTHKVGVCLDEYKSFALISGNAWETSDKKPKRTAMMTPIGILSLVLIVLSLTCLLFTFITYVIFSTLRTKAGRNIMVLCVLLFCAQFMFQFWIRTSDIDYWACALIGILHHTLWMNVFFWMNFCSFHMFRVFRTLDQPGRKVTTKWNVVIYSLYTVFGSAIFVLMNIFVIGGGTNFRRLGYGSGQDCFISTSLMLGLTFALPCGLIIISNLVLFAWVVLRIRRQPNMESSDYKTKETRNQFGICVRLSTITGITWLLGFLFVTIRVELLEYLFVVSNASQGVYIMLAFVCNRKVMRMYRKQFCTGKEKNLSERKIPMFLFRSDTAETNSN